MILGLFLLSLSSKTLVNRWQNLSLGAKALSFYSEKECSRWGKIAKRMDPYGNNRGLVSLMVFLLQSNRKSIHIWMCQQSFMLLFPGDFFFCPWISSTNGYWKREKCLCLLLSFRSNELFGIFFLFFLVDLRAKFITWIIQDAFSYK